jgi:2-oxo-3-hexenedioate decarboxylase
VTQVEQALLTIVQQARLRRQVIPSQQTTLDLAAAYRIQAALGNGRELRGYKLGLISPAKQAQMGINTPIYGRIYADMLLQSPVSLGQFLQPKLEPELVVVLKHDIPPATSPAAAWQAIEAAYLGIDILDSIWAGYHFTIAEVVADNASGGGFLQGTQPLHLPAEGTLRLSLNGVCRTEEPLAALGECGERLVWLAQQVGGLVAGQIIYLGSPSAAQVVSPGFWELQGPQESLLAVRFVSSQGRISGTCQSCGFM